MKNDYIKFCCEEIIFNFTCSFEKQDDIILSCHYGNKIQLVKAKAIKVNFYNNDKIYYSAVDIPLTEPVENLLNKYGYNNKFDDSEWKEIWH